jgi:2-hydroxymuconate-semialdehyde hydrolase
MPPDHFASMRGEFVDVGGCRLYYYAAGSRGAGDPVIFLHGFPAASHLWNGVVREMPSGHRLVVLDLLGFGRSDRPDDSAPATLTVTAHAARVRALMDELGIGAACIVGHAMGGAVAQALALGSPQRVTALCLVNSVAFDAWPRAAAPLARACASFPSLARKMGAPVLAGLVHGAMLRGYADEELGRRSLDHYLHAFTTHLGVGTLIAQLRAMHDPDLPALAQQVRTISVPTSITWGRGDPYLPPRVGEQLRDAIPGATLDIVESARHFTPEEAPERVARGIAELLQRGR